MPRRKTWLCDPGCLKPVCDEKDGGLETDFNADGSNEIFVTTYGATACVSVTGR